jgi:DNA-nicking Smr family endonuclease
VPFLKDEDIRRLTGFRDSAEYELDLRGLDEAHARASVERMLERSRFRPPRTVTVAIDKASPTSGATLFQPIGRMLVEAMKAGLVLRCRPLPDVGGGFWVELKGNPNAADEDDAEDAEEDDGGGSPPDPAES